ncbi:helix-turn-helix domain-containing protein, partial [Facklamia sp. 253]
MKNNELNHQPKKYKHLTEDQRLLIQNGLDLGMTFKQIAKRIKKDPTTISKEVKKHLLVKESDVQHFDKQGVPTKITCPYLLKAPFVCNACPKKSRQCGFDKHFYYAKRAQNEYLELLSESRENVALNKESFYEMDHIISNGIHNGQHLYHIIQTHDLPISKSTVYRHLKKG